MDDSHTGQGYRDVYMEELHTRNGDFAYLWHCPDGRVPRGVPAHFFAFMSAAEYSRIVKDGRMRLQLSGQDVGWMESGLLPQRAQLPWCCGGCGSSGCRGGSRSGWSSSVRSRYIVLVGRGVLRWNEPWGCSRGWIKGRSHASLGSGPLCGMLLRA